MKTSELTGAALDWAVAKCEGKADQPGEVTRIAGQLWCWEDGERMRYLPSDNWAQGGPIIEREGMCLSIQNDDHGNTYSGKARWWAQMGCRTRTAYGPTPLIAAMRCYVASKLGDTVDIPEELL